MTRDTSGPTSSTPFAYYDPDSRCLKTCQGTFLSDSTESSPTLPKSGWMRDGWCYELPMSVPRTAAPGCSSLPTPRATRGGSGTETMYALGAERTDEHRSQGQVLLPTPTSSDGMGGPGNSGRDGGDNLWTAVTLLPTPFASDEEESGPNQRSGSGDLRLSSAVQLFGTPTHRMRKGSTSSQRSRGAPKGKLEDQVEVMRHGASIALPSADGNALSDGQLPGQLSLLHEADASD